MTTWGHEECVSIRVVLCVRSSVGSEYHALRATQQCRRQLEMTDPVPLCRKTLAQLSPAVAVPDFDPTNRG
jgi:hypothetical protein